MAEYQKLQQKNGILKRAVVDEQQKRSSLELKIKVFFCSAPQPRPFQTTVEHMESQEAEQQNRRSLEEIDMLNFNNTRLTKRVEGLMERCLASGCMRPGMRKLILMLGPNGWRLPFKARLSLWASRPHTIGGSGAAQEEGGAGVVWRLVRQTDRIDKGLSLTFLLVVSHRLD